MTADDQKRIYLMIDQILWEDWDPIGINDIADIRDEYSSYVPTIFRMKLSGAGITAIAEKLYEFEIDNMELTGGNVIWCKEHCNAVARKIIDIV